MEMKVGLNNWNLVLQKQFVLFFDKNIKPTLYYIFNRVSRFMLRFYALIQALKM